MTIWLDELAKAVIEKEASGRRFSETGGPIFGYKSLEDVVVAAVFGPGPKARHRPRSLVPDSTATEEAIRQVHELSDGRYRYLGSWHTHPLGRPNPSGIDISTAKDISSQGDVALPRPLLLIQATRPTQRLVGIGPLAAYRWNSDLGQMEEQVLQIAELNARLIASAASALPERETPSPST